MLLTQPGQDQDGTQRHEDGDGAPVVAGAAGSGHQPVHRMTPSSVKVQVPSPNSGMV